MITKELNIRTTTSGFASPAESYVDRRLDLNDLIMKKQHRWSTQDYDLNTNTARVDMGSRPATQTPSLCNSSV